MKFLPLLAASFLVTGCASVEMAPKADSANAKQFARPAPNHAGLYVYRNSMFGKALKRSIWIDGNCLGQTASGAFFYTQVEGGKTIVISTEAGMTVEGMELPVESGKNYFIRQYITMGNFSAGSGLEEVLEGQGKQDVSELEMAKPGNCGS